jgi:hypothetical protein
LGHEPRPPQQRPVARRGAPPLRRRRTAGGRRRSDLSNTPPSIPKIPSCDLQTGGEDWLEFALCLKHSRFKDLSERLDQAKQLAEVGGVAHQQLGGHTYSIGPGSASAGKGKKRVHYRWRLQADNGLSILLMNREKRHGTMPNALATAKSVLLMSEGPEKVWSQIQATLEDLRAKLVANKLSRVDACTDLLGVDVEQFTRPYFEGHYVTRARTSADYTNEEQFVNRSGATYRLGNRHTGITVGSGEVRLRIYDKAHEVRGNADKQLLMYLRRWGVLFPTTASRVEFQLRRERLKSLGVDTFGDWLAKRGAVLDYLTNEWFRFTEGPYDRKHPDRTPTLAVWQAVQQRAQQWAVGSDYRTLAPLYLEPRRLEQLGRQVVGVVVTMLARENVRIISNEMFLEQLVERVEEIISSRDMAAEVYQRTVELGVYQP